MARKGDETDEPAQSRKVDPAPMVSSARAQPTWPLTPPTQPVAATAQPAPVAAQPPKKQPSSRSLQTRRTQSHPTWSQQANCSSLTAVQNWEVAGIAVGIMAGVGGLVLASLAWYEAHQQASAAQQQLEEAREANALTQQKMDEDRYREYVTQQDSLRSTLFDRDCTGMQTTFGSKQIPDGRLECPHLADVQARERALRRFVEIERIQNPIPLAPSIAEPTRTALGRVDLRGSALTNIDLRFANLNGVHFEGADLYAAKMQGAYLFGGHLEAANLANANLEGANLTRAHLEGASLTYAHLEGASLTAACLIRADLSAAKGLTQTQLGSAKGDGATKLPRNLMRPRHWTEKALQQPTTAAADTYCSH